MKNIITRLIADFHERKLPEFVRRDAHAPCLKGKITAIIGMRRAGKTYFLYQIMSDLLSDGIPKEQLLYLNFEDERLLSLDSMDLQDIPELYYQIYPALKDTTCYFFFDEIQNIPNWERFVRRILDTENVKICITGSSARLLSKEIATSLRGRALTTEIFPYTFKEFLRCKGIEIDSPAYPGSRKRAAIKHHLQAYLLTGGFPEIQDYADVDRINTLQEYVRSVIYRDLVERYSIRNVKPVKRLISFILNSPATRFSINKFYNHLKSMQISCKKDALYSYVDYLHDAYLLFPVRLHTRSEKARQVNPAKMYIVDTGLAFAHSHWPEPDWSHLLENFVFLELRKRGGKLDYYKTRSGKEVDFVLVNSLSGQKALVQVSLEITDKDTFKREIEALDEAMSETGIPTGKLITVNREMTIKVESGSIEVIPAWLWALQVDKYLGQARQPMQDFTMPGMFE